MTFYAEDVLDLFFKSMLMKARLGGTSHGWHP